MAAIIKIHSLKKNYGILPVLKDISFEVEAGEFLSITGPSGAGKSTLLHVIGTLDRPDSGTLYYNELNLMVLSDRKLARWRSVHLGFVFQFHHLLPEFTVLENVCLPAYLAGIPNTEAKSRAKLLLERLGLTHRLQHKPSELSGGESQRTAIARALINKPTVLLADEPSGNLDSQNAEALHQLLLDIQKEWGQTIIVVTHNPELARLANRNIYMRDGRVEYIEQQRPLHV